MECTAMSGIDSAMVDELLDALDMAMDQTPSKDFEGLMAATFAWDSAETTQNVHIMFPSYTPPGAAHSFTHSSPFNQQQVPVSTQLDVEAPAAQTAPMCVSNGTAPKSVASPFAGIGAADMLLASQTPAPAAATAAPAAVNPCSDYLAAQLLAVQQQQQQWQLQSLQHTVQQQQEQQQQQQQQQLLLQESAAPGTPGSDSDEQQQKPAGRRGRPPKNPGQYSKGYLAIKRYRQRKKGKVEQMETEVAEKLKQLEALQEEQGRLLHKQQWLEGAAGMQDAMLAQISQLRLSVGPQLDNNAADEAPPDELPEYIAHLNSQQQRRQQQQQATKAQHLLDVPALWRRYKQYIVDVSAKLAAVMAEPPLEQHQQQQQGSGSGGASSSTAGSQTFPPIPFSLAETLSLWKISRAAGVPQLASDSTGNSSIGTGVLAVAAQPPGPDTATINLQTGQHDVVLDEKWVKVAQQLHVTPEQKQQLMAAWRLYVVAVEKLNQERQQLVQQLQHKLAGNAAADGALQPPAAAAAAGLACSSSRAAGGARASGYMSAGAAEAVAVGPVGGGCCGSLSGEGLLDYHALADAIEWNLVRGRAMVMMYGWSMMTLLTFEQQACMCVASWPHFPLVRAVVGCLLAADVAAAVNSSSDAAA